MQEEAGRRGGAYAGALLETSRASRRAGTKGTRSGANEEENCTSSESLQAGAEEAAAPGPEQRKSPQRRRSSGPPLQPLVVRLSVPEERCGSGLLPPEHLGDHVLGDGPQGVQQLALQPGLHDQQIHLRLGEGERGIRPRAAWWGGRGCVRGVLPVLEPRADTRESWWRLGNKPRL